MLSGLHPIPVTFWGTSGDHVSCTRVSSLSSVPWTAEVISRSQIIESHESLWREAGQNGPWVLKADNLEAMGVGEWGGQMPGVS